jgi:hemolysin activation/secretion protein
MRYSRCSLFSANNFGGKPEKANLVVKQLTLFFLLYLFCLLSVAQVSIDPAAEAARQHEQRLQQEQQRQRDQIQSRQPDADIFLQPDIEQQTDDAALASGQCFDVQVIVVKGVTWFSGSDIEKITASYQQRCLNLGDINQLLKAITTLYIDDGLITSRAFLQPQNLKSGQLTILVVEGKLTSLESVDGSLRERQLYWAFPVENNNLLSLRDLEQGLEQLNRLQQNRAEMDVEPGAQPGESRVVVRNVPARSVHGGIGVNNTGSEATGEWLSNAWLSWDNPASSNDNLYLSVSDAIDNPDQAKSRSYSFSYSIPYGYGLYSYSTNYFEYQQLVRGVAIDFVTSGSSLNHTLTSDYTILRRQRDKIAFASALTRKESKNYLEDVFLETSSRVLYVVDVGVVYTRPLQRGMLRGSFKWHRSLDWFDATTKIVNAESDFQFDKYTVDASINTALEIFDTPFFYTSSVHLFYSPEKIIASEALSIGGRYTVRGIEGESLFGYRGGYWRNELTHTHYFINRGRLDTFIGLDLGASDTPELAEKGTELLAGAASGMRYINRGFSMDVAYSQALRAPGFLQGDQHGVYAALQIGF